MCRLAQSYRQNNMETILPSKEFVNDVEPAASICFQDWGAKIEHTFMTNFVQSFPVYNLHLCIIRTPLLQLKSVIFMFLCIIRTPYFTATGAVHAWPNTNVTPHKLTFKPGYHIYTFFLCHIFMYTGIYFCVADIYNEYLWVFSKLF